MRAQRKLESAGVGLGMGGLVKSRTKVLGVRCNQRGNGGTLNCSMFEYWREWNKCTPYIFSLQRHTEKKRFYTCFCVVCLCSFFQYKVRVSERVKQVYVHYKVGRKEDDDRTECKSRKGIQI